MVISIRFPCTYFLYVFLMVTHDGGLTVLFSTEESLKAAEKIREVKGNGERESYTQWNADFPKILRGYKKVLKSEECKN